MKEGVRLWLSTKTALLDFLHLDNEVLERVSLGQQQLVRNVGRDVNDVALLQLGFLSVLY
jgi:hypothetical protein